MTDQEIHGYRKYAYGMWVQHFKDNLRIKGLEREDFIQDFLLFVLTNKEDFESRGMAFMASKFLYKFRRDFEREDYKVENMTMFSALVARDSEDTIEYLCGISYDEYPSERKISCMDELAKMLYPDRVDLQDGFLAYMYDEPLWTGPQRRDCRDKLFYWRFKILDFLKEKGKITEREWARLVEIAQGMTKRQSTKKTVKNGYEASRQRTRYYENLEESRRKARERYHKRQERLKQEKECPTAGNK